LGERDEGGGATDSGEGFYFLTGGLCTERQVDARAKRRHPAAAARALDHLHLAHLCVPSPGCPARAWSIEERGAAAGASVALQRDGHSDRHGDDMSEERAGRFGDVHNLPPH
jgi:hypothetical protein